VLEEGAGGDGELTPEGHRTAHRHKGTHNASNEHDTQAVWWCARACLLCLCACVSVCLCAHLAKRSWPLLLPQGRC
jgi:hypothetical protein